MVAVSKHRWEWLEPHGIVSRLDMAHFLVAQTSQRRFHVKHRSDLKKVRRKGACKTKHQPPSLPSFLSTAILKMKLIIFLLCVLSCLICVAAQETAEMEETLVENTDASVDTDGVDQAADIATDTEEVEDLDAGEEAIPETQEGEDVTAERPVQSGPFIDLLGPSLLSIELTDPTTARISESLTNDALKGKKVIGLYFSADWYVFA